MTTGNETIGAGGDGRLCTVMVLYEDLAARLLAEQAGGRLIQRFAGEIEFEFNWWRFDYLADPQIACEAAWGAAKAEVILVSIHQVEHVNPALKSWLESRLPERSADQAALALIQVSPGPGFPVSVGDACFRSAARRTHLDYLPLSLASSLPQGLGWFPQEAARPATTGLGGCVDR